MMNKYNKVTIKLIAVLQYIIPTDAGKKGK